MSFQEQVIWITGASGGIGEAIALELSRQGASLILSARREDELARVKAACAVPDKVEVLPLDITDFDGMDAKVAAAIALRGRVDVLLNNAGVGMWAKAEKTSLETDRRIMDVDFFGPVALTTSAKSSKRRETRSCIQGSGSRRKANWSTSKSLSERIT